MTTTAITNNIVRTQMATYEIEQYEIHAQKYRIEADSEAEAIKMLFDGEADAVDNGLDYIEVCEDLGLPAEEHRELADQLRSLGVTVGEHVIPSIRSIEVESGHRKVESTRQPDHNSAKGRLMAVTFNKGKPNEITLRLVLQAEYGREYFDHHDTVDEMLTSIRNVIKLAAEDGGERMIGIAVVPVSDYGSENGNGFGLKTDTGNFA